MNTAERLAHAMADKSLTAAELGRLSGVKAVTIGTYIRDERNPPLDVCEKLGKATGFHGRWIFDGTGPKRLGEIQTPADETPFRSVPILDSVTAGRLVRPSSQISFETAKHIDVSELQPGDYFALRVTGNSMDRVSPEGSVIVVNQRDRTLRNGAFYVFAVDGDTTYKRWQDGDPPYLEAFSTDPTHRPIFIKRKRDLEVVGRVVRTMLDL